MSSRSSTVRTGLLLLFLAPLLLILIPTASGINQITDAPLADFTTETSVRFIQNTGQFDRGALFQVSGLGHTAWLTEDSIWVTTIDIDSDAAGAWRSGEMQRRLAHNSSAPWVTGAHVRLRFERANPEATVQPFGRSSSRWNYYLGDNPSAWVTGAPVWYGVRYQSLYPGLSLELSGDAAGLAARLVCADACSPARHQFNLVIEGATVYRGSANSLVLETAAGSVNFPLPEFLRADGSPDEAFVQWRVNGILADELPRSDFQASTESRQALNFSGNTAEILYGTFLGGGNTDFAEAIAVDREGRATVIGDTLSPDFPTTPGAFDGNYNGGSFPSGDVFVAQLNAAGNDLEYATFIGGGDSDLGFDGALDGSGNVYVTGWTASADFPTTNGAFDVTFNGDEDAYVLKLNTFGGLTYSTYLGGSSGLPDPDDEELEWVPSGFDGGYGLDVSSSGVVTVVGASQTPDFPVTPAAFDRDNDDYCSDIRFIYPCADGFIARLNPTGSELLFASYLGGADDDYATDLAVDSTGRAFVTGDTLSPDFPVTPDALDSSGGDFDRDAFFARVSSNGASLQYATYLGGENAGDGWYEGDQAAAIILDNAGHIYIAGETWSDDFPTTTGAFDTVRGLGDCPSEPYGDLAQCPDAFVLRLRPDGTALDFSTLLGGSAGTDPFFGFERATGLVLDSLGDVVVAGTTGAANFPTTPGAYSRDHNQTIDTFVARLNPTGTTLQYATLLNSQPGISPVALARNDEDDIFATGQTRSPLFPATAGAYDVTYNGNGDVFALRLALGPTPAFAGWLEVGAGSGSGGGISNSPGESSRPALLETPDGALIAAWSDGRGGNSQIFVRRWNGSEWVEMGTGSASGGGVSDTSGESSFPALLTDSEGSPVLAWQQQVGNDSEIYVRRWDSTAWVEMGNGSASGGGISNNNGQSSHPAMALVGEDVLVVWDDDSKGNLEIYGRAWDGADWVEVGGSASGGGISRNGGASVLPSVAVLDGRPLVAWGDDSGGETEIYARVFNGKRWANAGKGSADGGGISNSEGLSRGVDLVAGPNEIYAAWADGSGGDLEIYVLAYNGKQWREVGDGSARNGGISLNSGNSQSPSIVLNGSGRPAVFWYDGSSGLTQIFAREWDGTRWAEITLGTGRGGGISDNNGGSSWPAAVVTGSSIPYIAWADNSGGNFEIFVRRATTSTCYQLRLRHSGEGSDPIASPAQSFGCQPGWYTPGSTIQLTAAPATGWAVAGWDGTIDDSSTALTNIVTMPAQNHQVLVAYTTESAGTCYRLSLTHLGDGASPTASPSKVPNCLSGTYPAGTILTLTANPANGWVVSEWAGTNDDASTSEVNTVNMPAFDHTVVAVYAQSETVCHLLRLTFSGQGGPPTVDPTSSDGCAPGRFSPGETVSLLAQPATGWQVTAWSGTNNDTLTTPQNQLTMPDGIATVFVQYEAAPGDSFRLFLPAIGGRVGSR